jgi:hypothetical protein
MTDKIETEPLLDGVTRLVDLIEGVGEAPVETIADEPQAATARTFGFNVKEMNENYAVAIWGGKAVVINEQPAGPINDRVRVMAFESMNQWFANKPTEIVGSDGQVKTVTWAKAWQTHRDRRQYNGVEFFPNPDGAAGAIGYLNLYRGFSVVPSPAGSCSIFKDHLLTNVCNGDAKLYAYVFGWFAHMMQKPRERIGTALVLRGSRGSGKSKVGEVIGSLIAAHYFPVDDPRYITGQFNSHSASCLFLHADEAVWAGDKHAEGRLKSLITSAVQMIEAKGVDPIRMPNYTHVLMTSNEYWVVPAGEDERRFCVLDVGSHCAQNNEYFRQMDEQLDAGGRERLLYELQAFDLASVNLWKIPQTKALLDQKLQSLDSINDFWFNRLHDGLLMSEDDSWREQVIKADFYSAYLKDSARIGIGRKRGEAEFWKRMLKLAPGLTPSRPNVEVAPGIIKRTRAFDVPPLNECRANFEKFLGQSIAWPAQPTGEGGRGKYGSADDQMITG